MRTHGERAACGLQVCGITISEEGALSALRGRLAWADLFHHRLWRVSCVHNIQCHLGRSKSYASLLCNTPRLRLSCYTVARPPKQAINCNHTTVPVVMYETAEHLFSRTFCARLRVLKSNVHGKSQRRTRGLHKAVWGDREADHDDLSQA